MAAGKRAFPGSTDNWRMSRAPPAEARAKLQLQLDLMHFRSQNTADGES